MAASIEKIDKIWRVVDSKTGKPIRNKDGRPIDGGGHLGRYGAKKQANTYNINMRLV